MPRPSIMQLSGFAVSLMVIPISGQAYRQAIVRVWITGSWQQGVILMLWYITSSEGGFQTGLQIIIHVVDNALETALDEHIIVDQ
jgi:hypothetical protein